MTGKWCSELLSFWFDALRPEQWFVKDDALDETLRQRFGQTYRRVTGSYVHDEALSDPETALAHCLLLDQLPRNMFRGMPAAFESDAEALRLAKDAVARGLDRLVPPVRRPFFYLPLEHSENLRDQKLSVELFTALGDARSLEYAIAHRDIIARFGRFPHRNAVLGRISTSDEVAFLATPGSSF